MWNFKRRFQISDVHDFDCCLVLPARRGATPAIIAKFVRRSVRNNVMDNKKRLKEREDAKDIFITDSLTGERARLLRKLKEDARIKAAWSVDGKLKLIEQGTERKITINCLSEITKLNWPAEELEALQIFSPLGPTNRSNQMIRDNN